MKTTVDVTANFGSLSVNTVKDRAYLSVVDTGYNEHCIVLTVTDAIRMRDALNATLPAKEQPPAPTELGALTAQLKRLNTQVDQYLNFHLPTRWDGRQV